MPPIHPSLQPKVHVPVTEWHILSLQPSPQLLLQWNPKLPERHSTQKFSKWYKFSSWKYSKIHIILEWICVETNVLKSKQDLWIIYKVFLLEFSFRFIFMLIISDIDLNRLFRLEVSNEYVPNFTHLLTTKNYHTWFTWFTQVWNLILCYYFFWRK